MRLLPRIRSRPRLGWWPFATLALLTLTVLYTDTLRFHRPTGEKFVFPFYQGQTDFTYPWLGATALLAGVNPYLNDRPEFTHPIFAPTPEGYKQVYPPSHLVLFAPMVWWFGEWEKAAVFWEHLLLASVLSIAAIAFVLVRRLGQARAPWELLLVFGACLMLSVGVELGLDRGQSDAFVALLTWAGLLLYLRGSLGIASFLLCAASAIKGYPALMVVGLALLEITNPRFWKRAVPGALVAAVVLVLPAIRYFRDGVAAVTSRGSTLFWAAWYNHGFMNAVNFISPAQAVNGNRVLTGVALAICALTWVNAFLARRNPQRSYPLAFLLFATAAIGTVLGMSRTSVAYNLILFLPGVLIFICLQHRVLAELELSARARHAIGFLTACCAFLLFVHELGAHLPRADGIPASAYGLIGFLLLSGAVAGRAVYLHLRQPRRAPLTAGAGVA